MHLECPHCTENLRYDESLGGRAVSCPHCQKQLLMPALDQLTPDQQAAYRAEIERERKKQEREAGKQERLRQKEYERAAKRQEAQEAAAKRQAAAANQEASGPVVVEQLPRLHGPITLKPYRALRVMITLLDLCALLAWIVAGLGALVSMRGIVVAVDPVAILVWGLSVSVGAALIGTTYMAIAQAIRLFIDIANDARRTRATNTRMMELMEAQQAGDSPEPPPLEVEGG